MPCLFDLSSTNVPPTLLCRDSASCLAALVTTGPPPDTHFPPDALLRQPPATHLHTRQAVRLAQRRHLLHSRALLERQHRHTAAHHIATAAQPGRGLGLLPLPPLPPLPPRPISDLAPAALAALAATAARLRLPSWVRPRLSSRSA